jgi:membrane associated rhomboid family serine protease
MTDWLAGVSSLAFLLLFLTGHIDSVALLAGFIPVRWSDPALFMHLVDPGAAVPAWLTPLTATLVHAGWFHIGFNMLMLLFCGRYVEHVVGPWLLLMLYGVGAYAAAGAQWLATPASTSPMVGASGAISAILGTYALLYSQQKVKALGPIPANVVRMAWLAAGWIAVQLMIGIATQDSDGAFGHIAVAAHIGGFIAGLLLTRSALRMRFRKRPTGVQ